MKHSMLVGYQWATGAADLCTGALLYIAPALTLRMMGLHAPEDAAPYVSYIGAFVLSVGLSCIYGAWLLQRDATSERLETVWLLTAFARSAVAIYVIKGVLAGELEAPWMMVAAFDGVCAAVQGIGLRRGWLAVPRGPGARFQVSGVRSRG
ncbi:MAG TPA: hypothetical protein VMU71_10405 [Terracidiphilus sp.]|jgi:hypothetical protein|nr:hypothetical protein [Terracidiphilus sp.]